MKSRKEITVPGTSSLFQDQYHAFRLLIRKKGAVAKPGSGLGATIPNRFATRVVVLKLGALTPPQLQLQYDINLK